MLRCDLPTFSYFYQRQDLNCKMLQKYVIFGDFEILKLEIKLSKSKWLVLKSLPSQKQGKHTSYKSTNENILLMGNFNKILSNPSLVNLVSELRSLLSRPTFFKSANHLCIGNFLTTRKFCFMKTLTLDII